MTTYFQIADWDEHYEVDERGHMWKPDKEFRQGPLEYIRVRARRDWNHWLIMLKELAGEEMWFVLGVFEKLGQIVACEPRDLRAGGIIRYSDGEPATREQLARMLMVKVSTIERVLGILTHPEIQWIDAVSEGVGVCLSPEISPRHECSQTSDTVEVPEVPEVPEMPEVRESPGLAEISGTPGSPGNPGKIRPNQVKSNQEQDKSSHSQETSHAERAPRSQVGTRVSVADDDRRSLSDSDMTRLRLRVLYHLRQVLKPPDERGHVALSNFEQWLYNHVVSGRAGPDLALYRQAVDIAQDCVNGRSPVAVFLSRVQQQLGYVPPSRQSRAMTGSAGGV